MASRQNFFLKIAVVRRTLSEKRPRERLPEADKQGTERYRAIDKSKNLVNSEDRDDWKSSVEVAKSLKGL